MTTGVNATASAGAAAAIGDSTPAWHKVVGVTLATVSALFIGASYVLKKRGLLDANVAENKRPGEGYGYLKNSLWWTGMIMMLLGEVCNMGAYAFSPAIIVTPLGAGSVVVSAVMSDIFLKEKLNFTAKIGCAQCVFGAILLAINGPATNATTTLMSFWKFVIDPIFQAYLLVNVIVLIYLIYYAASRWGDRWPIVYILICSLVGAFVVTAMQGLGSAVVYSAAHPEDNQFKQWSMYPLVLFVVLSGVLQINYLNKALNIFSTAVVTPIYYVCFTTATLICSSVLFRDFNFPSAIAGVSAVLGFLVIIGGVALLFAYSLQTHGPSAHPNRSLSDLRSRTSSLRQQLHSHLPTRSGSVGSFAANSVSTHLRGGGFNPVDNTTERMPLTEKQAEGTRTSADPFAESSATVPVSTALPPQGNPRPREQQAGERRRPMSDYTLGHSTPAESRRAFPRVILTDPPPTSGDGHEALSSEDPQLARPPIKPNNLDSSGSVSLDRPEPSLASAAAPSSRGSAAEPASMPFSGAALRTKFNHASKEPPPRAAVVAAAEPHWAAEAGLPSLSTAPAPVAPPETNPSSPQPRPHPASSSTTAPRIAPPPPSPPSQPRGGLVDGGGGGSPWTSTAAYTADPFADSYGGGSGGGDDDDPFRDTPAVGRGPSPPPGGVAGGTTFGSGVRWPPGSQKQQQQQQQAMPSPRPRAMPLPDPRLGSSGDPAWPPPPPPT